MIAHSSRYLLLKWADKFNGVKIHLQKRVMTLPSIMTHRRETISCASDGFVRLCDVCISHEALADS